MVDKKISTEWGNSIIYFIKYKKLSLNTVDSLDYYPGRHLKHETCLSFYQTKHSSKQKVIALRNMEKILLDLC